jgi:starch phosphorylase
VPIQAITNGIHVQTWVSPEMGQLLDRYLDPAWRSEESRIEIWDGISQVPDAELWRTHERRREQLVAFARERLRTQLERRGAPRHEIETAEEVLNPDALTIGFARRFATYKRATLLMSDIDRLKALVNHAARPVQFIFAGKAHPHDTQGKEFIRRIVNIARDPDLRHAIVFLENYDMHIARYLVQGVDVWLNTPQRPKEASGTSGMKVIYNGGLNCSILDGWWAEAYNPNVGWAIGNGEQYAENESDQQDYIESEALYNILEHDIVPSFYERGNKDGLPREWIHKIKESIRVLGPYFNTRRMVQEYTDVYYMPSYKRSYEMTHPTLEAGLNFVEWRSKVTQAWGSVRIRNVETSATTAPVGTEVEVVAHVHLGGLTPDDVRVQLYYGGLNTRGEIAPGGAALDMKPNGKHAANGDYTFKAKVRYNTSGERGISVRVVPHHEFLHTPFQPGMITWA